MSKILFLTKMDAGEIIGSIAVTSTMGADLTDSITKNLSEIDSCDMAIVGFGDQALEDYQMLLQTLISFRDSGKPILFLHGNPNAYPGSSQAETYQYYNNLYKSNLEKLGFDNVEDRYDFTLYSEINVLSPSHPVFSTWFDLTSMTPEIQETHLNGVYLGSNFNNVIEFSGEPSSNRNFYLSVMEEEGKGKVAVCNTGHNDFSIEKFLPLGEYESKLIINLIIWFKMP